MGIIDVCQTRDRVFVNNNTSTKPTRDGALAVRRRAKEIDVASSLRATKSARRSRYCFDPAHPRGRSSNMHTICTRCSDVGKRRAASRERLALPCKCALAIIYLDTSRSERSDGRDARTRIIFASPIRQLVDLRVNGQNGVACRDAFRGTRALYGDKVARFPLSPVSFFFSFLLFSRCRCGFSPSSSLNVN